MSCLVVVLAAGKGTRMKSDLPKVLHEVSGRVLLDFVLDLGERVARADHIVVVVGHRAGRVEEHVRDRGVLIALQEPQLGTGDALRVAVEIAPEGDVVLVLSGDVPLLRKKTLDQLLDSVAKGAEAALLTAVLTDPGAYGRVLRGPDGSVSAVVEARDADANILALNEVNAGVYAFRRASLEQALASLKPDNAQGEYYLTDVVRWLTRRGLPVAATILEDPEEMQGVNTREDLRRVEQVLEQRLEN
ncbi:MAG: UDP-N-acetylglucosamine pyrophosphorylase [Acidobacteria bacterium]|nr:MAG: UDP-N-acetylglucosamine pyrophosphorylase [Acidobacteriota bacterium]